MEVSVDKSQRATTAEDATPSPALSVQIRKQREHFALQVDCVFPPGISILFGASGAGKTTLLDCIAGLARPDAGRIAIGNRDLFANGEAIPVEHRKIGYVFQDLALFPHLTVEANVEYGLGRLSHAERQGKSGAMLDSFRIAHLKARKPSEISGGERQRVALARALLTDPCALLLDEPLAALDASTKARIIDDLRVWNQAHRTPVVYVTHSRDEVFALGERVLVMEDGRIAAAGTPHEVMSAPRRETVAQLSGFENIFEAEVTSIHEERGTMVCRLASSPVELETPLVRADVGQKLLVGIQAGDILLATAQPVGLSARNLLPGKVVSLVQRDVIVTATVECGVAMAVHLTLAARDALSLQPGCAVWLVIKTHSCHLMAR